MTDQTAAPVPGLAMLADLTPDPENARRHTPRNVGTIVDALHEVGAARSIVVDEHGVILAGNATAEAAAEAGIHRVQIVDADGETLIAVRRTGLTPAQKRRLALFDNRAAELAEWDADRLAAFLEEDASALAGMFERDELAGILEQIDPPAPAEDPGAQVDRAEELRATWQTARGQLWQIGRHRLLCGDSTDQDDVARLMGEERADVLWTDPPYGIAYRDTGAGTWNAVKLAKKRAGTLRPRFEKIDGDDLDPDALLAFLTDAFAALVDGCRPDAAWYVWHACSTQDVFATALAEAGYEIRSVLVWAKSRPAFNFSQYKYQHEPCFYAFRAGTPPAWYGDRAQTTLWSVPSESGHTYEHPTQKPTELAIKAIENSSRRDGIVLDPFVGSGTALVAAEQAGRACYAMDISPAYVAVCLERLAGMGLAPRLAD